MTILRGQKKYASLILLHTKARRILGRFLSVTFLDDLLSDLLMEEFHCRINFRRTNRILRRLSMHKRAAFCNNLIFISTTCKKTRTSADCK